MGLKDKFVVYSWFIDCINSDKELRAACRLRENRFSVAKTKEHILALILNADVVSEIGYDITNSKYFKSYKIEIKTTCKPFYNKNKKILSNKAVIINKFSGINNKKDIVLNADLYFFNFEIEKITYCCLAKDLINYLDIVKNKIVFDYRNLPKLKSVLIKWPTSPKKLNVDCALEIMDYATTPLPERRFGSFEEYIKRCFKKYGI